ncbi:MAG: TRAM domain-containing protein [Candidatus Aenigmarchaeota archaeon]|nr:TRAM domain-containing protein [Candidatus Aenigmarchaeota archaeon]
MRERRGFGRGPPRGGGGFGRGGGGGGGGFRDRDSGGFGDKPKPIKEGEEYTVKITDVGAKGDGITKIENFIVFVPGTKKGDEVRIRIKQVSQRFAVGEKIGESAGGEEGSEEPSEPEEPQDSDWDESSESKEEE